MVIGSPAKKMSFLRQTARAQLEKPPELQESCSQKVADLMQRAFMRHSDKG